MTLNGKQLKLPKLGLKHHKLVSGDVGIDENLKAILKSIHPDLTAAESDMVCIHLLAFNSRLKDEVVKDGFTYRIDDIYISQRLEQQFSGNTFKFRSNKPFEQFSSVDNILNECFVEVNGSKEVPNFMGMPAFVAKWAEDIINTISIKGPYGPIKGIGEIMELFK